MVYTFKYWSSIYTGQTSRQLETRNKEHVSKFVREHIKNQPMTVYIATSNAKNRSLISKHLVENQNCVKLVIKRDSKHQEIVTIFLNL